MVEQDNCNLDQITAKLSEIEQQYNRLLRQNKILKRIGMIATLLIIVVLLMGQAFINNGIVEAKGFVLCDKQGKERAKLIIKDGGPLLEFIDDNKRERLFMALSNGDPSIVLCNKLSQNRAALFVANDSSHLVLLDKDNKPVFIAPQE